MDELDDAAPNCPRCLVPLEAAGADPEQPYWLCPSCRRASIAVSS